MPLDIRLDTCNFDNVAPGWQSKTKTTTGQRTYFGLGSASDKRSCCWVWALTGDGRASTLPLHLSVKRRLKAGGAATTDAPPCKWRTSFSANFTPHSQHQTSSPPHPQRRTNASPRNALRVDERQIPPYTWHPPQRAAAAAAPRSTPLQCQPRAVQRGRAISAPSLRCDLSITSRSNGRRRRHHSYRHSTTRCPDHARP